MASLDTIGKLSNTEKVNLYHPVTGEQLFDDDGKPMWIEVCGHDSAQYKAARNEQLNERIKASQRSGKTSMTAEQNDAMALELLVKCTNDWHIILGGGPLAFNEKNVREVYQDYPWLREQVDLFIHDRKNFLTH